MTHVLPRLTATQSAFDGECDRPVVRTGICPAASDIADCITS